MVKLKVNVKTKNDSIPSDTTKRKMPVITNPKILGFGKTDRSLSERRETDKCG